MQHKNKAPQPFTYKRDALLRGRVCKFFSDLQILATGAGCGLALCTLHRPFFLHFISVLIMRAVIGAKEGYEVERDAPRGTD
jgi:hypothetical protein